MTYCPTCKNEIRTSVKDSAQCVVLESTVQVLVVCPHCHTEIALSYGEPEVVWHSTNETNVG